MEQTYTIHDLSLMSGLTTRTLRNYLNSGILQGDKSEGIWKFTELQISDFISHPSVSSSIQAKNKAIVFDFLANQKKKSNEICVILDFALSQNESHQLYEQIAQAINTSKTTNLRFSYEHHDKNTRIILSAPKEFVLEMLKIV